MRKPIYRFNILFIVLLVIGILTTCLDPFPLPDVSSGFLVVEGTFTDDAAENSIRLTFAGQVNKIASHVYDATVMISDDRGNSGMYQYTDEGIYQPVSGDFYGVPGRKYILRIELPDGRVYQSDSTSFRAAVPIEDLWYEPIQAPSPDGTEWWNGVEFYLDTQDPTNENRYFLWKYEETWETGIPNPIRHIYLGQGEFEDVATFKRCFFSDRSRSIMIKSTVDQVKSEIRDYPIIFVPNTTSRLWRHYRIVVKQYSLSEEAFLYHEKLQEITEQTGTIIDQQPYTLRGNVRNVNDPDEIVMGYFIVSAVSRRSTDINSSELPLGYRGIDNKLLYCKAATSMYGVTTFLNYDILFYRWLPRWGMNFVGLVYDDSSLAYPPPVIELEFAPPECTICEGTQDIPLDWDE